MQPWFLRCQEQCTWQWPFCLKPANLRNWKSVSGKQPIKLPAYHVAFPHWTSAELTDTVTSQSLREAVGTNTKMGALFSCRGSEGYWPLFKNDGRAPEDSRSFLGKDLAPEKNRSCHPFRLGHTLERTYYITGSRQQEFSITLVWNSEVKYDIPGHMQSTV